MRPGTLIPLIAIGIVVAHAVYLSLFVFGDCERSPGGPERCFVEPSPPALMMTVPMAMAGGGIAFGRPAIAWTAVLPALALALLFGLGVGGALLAHVGITVVAVAAWHILVWRRRRVEGPPASA